MLPAANHGVGTNIGFPDTCLTPAAPSPVPVPYPNMGMNATAMPFVPNVMVSCVPAHNMSAKPLMTNGDNAGVAHPLVMQSGGCIMGNPIVHMGMQPSEHLTVPTQGNSFNCPPGAKLVPSVTNVLVTDRALTTRSAHELRLMARDLRLEQGAVSAELLGDGVGLIRVRRFSLSLPAHLAGCVEALAARGARALLIDLRGNPGGALSAAVGAASLFLPARTLVARVAVSGRTTQRLSGSAGGRWSRLPLVVLVDERTASAAEVFAAGLQDQGRALVVGARSYGKGTGELLRLGRAAAQRTETRIQVGRPRGGWLQGAGVGPDLIAASSDPHAQLHAAWSMASRALAS
jgi:carboxyl-terminal processing protease